MKRDSAYLFMLQWYDYIFIIVSLVVIVLALLQGGKSEGASGAITGGGLNIFVQRKERGSEKIISWLTFGFAIVWLFLALLIMVLNTTSASSGGDTSSASDSAVSAAMVLLPFLL